jgi:hypothetical protein
MSQNAVATRADVSRQLVVSRCVRPLAVRWAEPTLQPANERPSLYRAHMAAKHPVTTVVIYIDACTRTLIDAIRVI